MEYRVTVEYIVNSNDEESAVSDVRNQLEQDDELGHNAGENRLDYILREVH